jgi:hypothetical protein
MVCGKTKKKEEPAIQSFFFPTSVHREKVKIGGLFIFFLLFVKTAIIVFHSFIHNCLLCRG